MKNSKSSSKKSIKKTMTSKSSNIGSIKKLPALVKLNNFSLSINNKHLIKNWNFNIYRGDVIAVLGRNGSGKTTLVKAVAGLIEIPEERLQRSISARISYMPQTMKINLNVPITVKDFMMMHAKTIDRALVEELKIDGVLERKLGSISGGELQKVLFYNAIQSNSNLVILDEPENHLDDPSIDSIVRLIHNSPNRAFLIVSHEHQKILEIANHVLEINDSGIVCRSHNKKCEKNRGSSKNTTQE